MTTNWKAGLGFSLLTVIMWGLLPLALKQVLAVMDPVTISWYRFSLSAAIALLWYGYKSGPALKALFHRNYRVLSIITVLGLVGNYLFYNWGLNEITPGASQILIQIAPMILLIGSVLIFRERLSPGQWVGVITLVLGLLLFFHQRLSRAVFTSDSYLYGIAMMIGAAVLWACYGLAQKQLLLAHHAKDLLLLICLGGTLLLLPSAEPMQIVELNNHELALLVFAGVNTIVAYGSFGLAMSHWPASRVSAVITLTPIFTLLFTFVANHWLALSVPAEPLDWLSYMGALLVVSGASVVALRKMRTQD